MASYVCEQCGERNTYGTTFCVSCGAFLAWDDDDPTSGSEQPDAVTVHATDSRPQPQSRAQSQTQPEAEPEAVATVIRPPVDRTATGRPATSPAPTRAGQTAPVDPTLGLFRVLDEPAEITVPVSGEAAALTVRVTNLSDIVDGYVVEAPTAPGWLVVQSSEVRLLPGTDELVSTQLRVRPGIRVPAQRVSVTLRLRSVSQPGAHRDVRVQVVVPALDVPVRLRAEPRLLRVRDRDEAEFTVVVDNSGSNGPAQVQLAGTDPELAVRFRFDPPVLMVGPGTTGAAQVLVTAARPEAGQELTRSLTVTATEVGRPGQPPRSAETVVTLQQASTARVESPPVTLAVEPGLLRVRDTTVGIALITADNRAGTDWVHLQLRAGDPERLVRVTWTPAELDVPPGGVAQVEARFEAPLPEAGSEVSRTVTISATDGRRTSATTATYVQVSSPSPMSTLAVRVEPSVMRIHDTDGAIVQVVLDNRRARSGVRVALQGSDPERAVGFSFSPPVVDVGPGQVLAVPLTVTTRPPDPGQELTRSFTVTATDNRTSVDGSGSLVLSSSRAAMELLTVRLDPSVVRLENRRRGRLTAVVDNRNGVQPVRVAMQGDDPENVVRFDFSPSVLEIPPGRVARTVVSVRAPRPRARQQVTRPFLIAASDDRSAAQTEGSIIQSSGDRRPLARALFTVLGALAMVVGSFQEWLGGLRGVDLNAAAFQQIIDLGGFEDLVTVGLVMIGLGFLVLFGLTGRSGRLTRFAAFLGAALLVALFVVVALFFGGGTPAGGAALVLLGCILGYVGGLLRPR